MAAEFVRINPRSVELALDTNLHAGIRLGSTVLQLVGVANPAFETITGLNPDNFLAPAVVIDPQIYDITDGRQGMNRLRLNKSMVLGRGSEATDTLDRSFGSLAGDILASRTHAALVAGDGKVSLGDLGSKHGTFINTETSSLYVPASQMLWSEMADLTRLVRTDDVIQEYVKSNQTARKGVGATLLPQRLHDYYYSVSRRPETDQRPPMNDVERQNYGIAVQAFKQKHERRLFVESYWTKAITGGRPSQAAAGSRGRLYLNLEPRTLVATFESIMEAFDSADVPATLKFPTEGWAAAGSADHRADNVVIYLGSADIITALQRIETIHQDTPAAFRNSLPRFVARLNTAQGSLMHGVGFAESDHTPEDKSFGAKRCELLTRVLRQESEAVDKMLSMFYGMCQWEGIDPSNPAFNTRTERNPFSPLIPRLAA